MSNTNVVRKPSFIRLFFSNFLKISVVVVIILTIAFVVFDKIYRINTEKISKVSINNLCNWVIYDIGSYYSGNYMPKDKICEIKKTIVDLWETNHVAVEIQFGTTTIDSSECLILSYYQNNKESYLFLDDFMYPEFVKYYDEIREYSQYSNYRVGANFAYIHWITRTFYPGEVSIINRLNSEVVDTIDLTPSDRSLIRRYNKITNNGYYGTWEPMTIRLMGNTDADSLNYNYEETLWAIDRSGIEIPLTVRICETGYDYALKSFLKSYSGVTLTVVLGIDILISLFLSLSGYYKDKNTYEIIAYRRKTTDAMAHDLKTPLAIANIYYEKLRENKNADKTEDYFDQLKNSLDYMNELITSILIYSKTQYSNVRVVKERVSVRKEFESVIDKLTPMINRRNLTWEIEGDAVYSVDRNLWTQAISNILVNAVKYSVTDSNIDISITKDEITINNKIEEDIDNPEKLLEPFVKGDATRGENTGSGLGLAVVNENLKRMGFVTSLSSVDKTFIVSIKKKRI